AWEEARARASGEHVVVGVNQHVEPPQPATFAIHRIDPEVEVRQVASLRAVRARRDARQVAALLDRLRAQGQDPAVNLMPVTIELVRARASLGEIVAALRAVWGSYVERPAF
ncbi:MAG: methylmalonyl-CoA mutase family protein, partial [Candidatus Rokuibacteriota bacterium]